MNKHYSPKLEILLVEDNMADVVLLQEVLEETGIAFNLHTAYDGEEALAFLRREGVFVDDTLPDMGLLDLNIPRKHGCEVLREIKEDSNLKHIPVIVMTTSRAEEDVLKCYRLHANCYIVKPVGPEQFARVVKAIESFWFTTATLPTHLGAC